MVFLSLSSVWGKEKELSPEQISKKKEVLSKMVRYGTSQERKQALYELTRFPKESAGELYTLVGEQLKTEKDMGMKIVLLKTIGDLDLKENKDTIIGLFEDSNEDVAKQAVTSAKKMKLAEATSPLLEKVKKEDFTKNSNSLSLYISALGELPEGKVAAPFLETKFREKFNNADMRGQIALYFGSVLYIDAESALMEVAFDEIQPTTLRCYSMNTLGKLKSESAKPRLYELLDSLKKTAGKLDAKKAQSLKIYAIGALVTMGDKEVFQELNEFARDDDSMVRLRAIEFMGNLKDPKALELLEYKRDRDPSPKVQKAAKKAIDQINGKETVPDEEKSPEEKPEEEPK
ncbi:HEAT repeat domain-containing protein [Leptospira bandrabouensis]|uniref:HEAT repeat domain-containing protein n=1 Tax=Leptospira bandrabouensis TaxID=2484903 RepID=UPI001EECF0F9|nr:HEAT repeat domain-containing protein [Leptospira bandrabouensis]MCG6151867.1 HEAT repeat domain-containing protein [Leptospira bandrabouensis]